MKAKAMTPEPKAKHAATPWRVAAPGTHGKGWRVVHDIGVDAISGKPFAGAVCDISASRSSADNYSDATEKANAAHIVHCVNCHDELVHTLANARNEIRFWLAEFEGLNSGDRTLMESMIAEIVNILAKAQNPE